MLRGWSHAALGHFGELGFALDQGEQAAFVPGADEGVASQSPRRVLRATMAGRSEIRFYWGSGRVQRSCRTFVVTFPAPPPTAPEAATIAFVIPNHLEGAFMARLMPCSLSQPLICSGDERIWRNFA